MGFHPLSERPFEILNSPIPGLGLEDVIDDSGSVMQEEHSSLRHDGGLSEDDWNLYTLKNHRKIYIKPQQKPKEEIMNVAFILDRIPSYLMVISRVQDTVAQDSKSSGIETEVA